MDLDLQVNLKFRLVVVLRESREHQQCYPILTTQAAEQSSKRPFGASFEIGIVTLWFHFKQFKGQIRTQRPKEDNRECELAHGRLEKVTLMSTVYTQNFLGCVLTTFLLNKFILEKILLSKNFALASLALGDCSTP